MSTKITRATQKLFGTSDTGSDFAQFGAFAAGKPTYIYTGAAITPALVQALSNFATGLKGAVVGNNSPMLEDLNGLFYLFAYQLAYLMEMGVPEVDGGTTYFAGSIVNSSGVLYRCVNDNSGAGIQTGTYPVTNSTYWSTVGGGGNFQNKSANYQMLVSDSTCAINGGYNATLPDATTCNNSKFTVINGDGNSGNGIKTLSSQTINGVNCTSTAYNLAQQYQFIEVQSDGSNYWIISAG